MAVMKLARLVKYLEEMPAESYACVEVDGEVRHIQSVHQISDAEGRQCLVFSASKAPLFGDVPPPPQPPVDPAT